MPPGPNGLRYLDYFLGLLAGSRLGTGARLEIITMIRGFATMYGAMQAAPASTSEQTTAQVQALTSAAAQGRYPISPQPSPSPARRVATMTSSAPA